MKTQTIVDNGFDGILVEVECQISNGLPTVQIVGFANKSVDEAKERIRAAFSSSNIPFPKKRIVINLAPADLQKDQAGLDLAIAASILESAQSIPKLERTVGFFGELSLDGDIRPIRGIIGKLLAAKNNGLKTVFIPSSNGQQAELTQGLHIYPVNSLKDLYLHLTKTKLLNALSSDLAVINTKSSQSVDFLDVIGQNQAKRALEISAAGGHNVLLNGPPGTGKSMLAKAFVSILPPMSLTETIETTHVHSLCGNKYETIVSSRPLRSPHHSASDTAIVGGGRYPKPGEISLAHNGVLFFDEFPEFKRNALEALRQPLEDKKITVSRAKDSLEFPANFIFLATANPCPCGFFGTDKECTCMPHHIHNYRRKLSGPIIDRIDIYANVNSIEHSKLLGVNQTTDSSQKVQSRVISARDTQKIRYNSLKTNSAMTNTDIKTKARLNPEAKEILDSGSRKLGLSPRAYMRTIKVARTIADLGKSDTIGNNHVAEALQYRPIINTE